METRTRNRVIAFRVTPAERRKIEAKVRQSGLCQQEYLLHAALETPILVVEDLKPLLGELRAWGRNREPADRPGPSGAHSVRGPAGGHGRAGQGLRGGQRTPDRGRAGGNPWRRAVSSVRRRQTAGAMGGVLRYVAQEQKTVDTDGTRYLTGVNCMADLACQSFLATKNLYSKASGTWFYHYVQSFSPQEHVTPAEAHQIAQELTERFFPGCEVLVATHIDQEHLHSHPGGELREAGHWGKTPLHAPDLRTDAAGQRPDLPGAYTYIY